MAEMAEKAEMVEMRSIRKDLLHCPVPPTFLHVSTEAPHNRHHCK